jgi:LuxR family maltose regulon positive regulatory protein
MLSTLLTTKFYRPRPTSGFLARARLTRRLDDGLRNGHPLILVVAPAGYGKTMLVSHWIGETGIPSTWLLLDEGDNDPVRFFTYVVAALRQLDPQVGQSLLDTLRSPPWSAEALACPLINDLAAIGRPVVLALDDYHLITHALVQEAMAFLVECAPPNLHLVVLTRADPPFPLPRLRVRERLTEIRDHDLRFTAEEMSVLLNSVHGLNLAAEQIAALESRTEGWVAGVQLAALSLEGCSPEHAAQFIQAFSGSHHYIIDYLGDEVLRHQPEEVQAFLLQTSILERLCGSLCDAVLGGAQGGDQTLLELERRNLFITPLDDERHWYRYHHLFSDLLFQRLRHTQPERVSDLCVRAALWHELNGYLEKAVEFALRAQDWQLATRLMEQVKYRVAVHGDIPMLISWLSALPEELLRSQPELCFGYASMLTLEGYFEAAEKWLRLMEDGFRPIAASDRHAALRLAKVPTYRSVYARFRGDYSAAVALAQDGLDQTPTTELHDRAVALLFLGQAHFHAGNAEAAERALSECMQSALASGHLTAYLNSCHHFAELKVLQGRLHEAREIYQQAMLVVEEQGKPVYAGTEHAGLADLYREWNLLEDAATEMQKGVELCEAGQDLFFSMDVYRARVRLALAQKDWESASNTIYRAEQVARRSPTSKALENLRPWRARLHLAQGHLAEAELWAESRAAEEAGALNPQQEFELLTLARVRLAQGKTDAAAALLERIRIAAEKAGRHGRVLEAHMLQALADQAAGKEAQAVERLGRVLAEAEPEGYVRLFIDEGAAMAGLLCEVSTRTTSVSRDYARKLLAAFSREGAERPVSSANTIQDNPLIEPLSERELEVLHLIAAGCSNRDVADRLVISVRTVKKHVENIHGKLGVKSRTQAVAAARELKLL